MDAASAITRRITAHLTVFALIALIGGCAQLIGKPDEGDLPDPARPVRINYVETLRNQDSLLAERYRQINRQAPAATSLQRPVAVAADAFRVYVVDRSVMPRLFIFDRGERATRIVSTPTPTTVVTESFLDPSAIAADATGDMYVADPPQGKVFGMDRLGNILFTIGKTGFLGYPSALAVDSNRHRLYVADKHAHKVLVYTNHGDWLRDIGDRDVTDGLRTPLGLALDGGGNLYVLDGHKKRVHVFSGDGVLLRRFSLVSDLAHSLNNPTGLAVDSDGHIYVSDSAANAILIFDQNGMYLQRWGGIGDQPEGFWSPAGIYIDSRNTIYIADQMNGRIQVFQYEK